MPGTWPLLSINLGKAVPFRDGERSAIGKSAADRPVAVGPLGLEGDEQADLTVHGGPEKAIHHYPHDHYPHWMVHFGGHELLSAPGAFGENVSTEGLLEDAVCIGDRFRFGTALVEVSQGRQPCWKIDHRFGRKGVLNEVVRTGRSGWYYRVIESGIVAPGDTLALVDRPRPEWTVARAFTVLIAGGHKADPGALDALADDPLLAIHWRWRAATLRAQ